MQRKRTTSESDFNDAGVRLYTHIYSILQRVNFINGRTISDIDILKDMRCCRYDENTRCTSLSRLRKLFNIDKVVK